MSNSILEQRANEYNMIIIRGSNAAKWHKSIFAHPDVIDINDFLEDITELFKCFIGGDCWAVKFNDEIIYNLYDNTKTVREHIMNEWVRECLYTNKTDKYVKDLFEDKMLFGDKVNVFLFGKNGYRVEYECVHIDDGKKGIKINIYCSEVNYNDDYDEWVAKMALRGYQY